MPGISNAKHAKRRRPAGRTSQRLLVLGIVPFVLASGTAYAYWSSTGVGSADAKAATATPLGVTSVAAPPSDLFPGKTSDLSLVVSNSNAYDVTLTKITGVSATSSDEVGCPGGTYIRFPSDVTAAIAAGGYALPNPISVPAGSSSTAATVAGLVTMTTSAPDACQGKTFTISLSFSGSQV